MVEFIKIFRANQLNLRLISEFLTSKIDKVKPILILQFDFKKNQKQPKNKKTKQKNKMKKKRYRMGVIYHSISPRPN